MWRTFPEDVQFSNAVGLLPVYVSGGCHFRVNAARSWLNTSSVEEM